MAFSTERLCAPQYGKVCPVTISWLQFQSRTTEYLTGNSKFIFNSSRSLDPLCARK
ncbi:unnamed protein product [Chondrus crispus]|uniref:Uncharacterized protein n=1 Tax=Chondrus crispus TaxID=2769 RepID=R7QEJ7_CHOCR|nr:unnamed protein product [Chondrus crispus]CDF36203.1 unnamed protein product [Chondrus crispus]|eukprot:XP_005716022.1 unnamed protein product [Chondrus crispus]